MLTANFILKIYKLKVAKNLQLNELTNKFNCTSPENKMKK